MTFFIPLFFFDWNFRYFAIFDFIDSIMSYFATRLNFTYAEPFDSLSNQTDDLYKQILSDTFANLPSDQKRIHNKVYNKAVQQLELKALLLPDNIWKQCLLTQLTVLQIETTAVSRKYFGTPSKQELEALCWKYLFSH
jgi:hypothetical protein